MQWPYPVFRDWILAKRGDPAAIRRNARRAHVRRKEARRRAEAKRAAKEARKPRIDSQLEAAVASPSGGGGSAGGSSKKQKGGKGKGKDKDKAGKAGKAGRDDKNRKDRGKSGRASQSPSGGDRDGAASFASDEEAGLRRHAAASGYDGATDSDSDTDDLESGTARAAARGPRRPRGESSFDDISGRGGDDDDVSCDSDSSGMRERAGRAKEGAKVRQELRQQRAQASSRKLEAAGGSYMSRQPPPRREKPSYSKAAAGR